MSARGLDVVLFRKSHDSDEIYEFLNISAGFLAMRLIFNRKEISVSGGYGVSVRVDLSRLLKPVCSTTEASLILGISDIKLEVYNYRVSGQNMRSAG